MSFKDAFSNKGQATYNSPGAAAEGLEALGNSEKLFGCGNYRFSKQFGLDLCDPAEATLNAAPKPEAPSA